MVVVGCVGVVEEDGGYVGRMGECKVVDVGVVTGSEVIWFWMVWM